jgi:hypothetical protein
MISILSSQAKSPSAEFTAVSRKKDEDNIAWLGRNLPAGGDVTNLVLLGGRSQTAFRLRLAQAHLRHDLVPSYWSHVFLLKASKNVGSSAVIEVSLEPAKGFGFPAPLNAVQKGKLSAYHDPVHYPNIAVLGIPIAEAGVIKALDRFQKQRAVLDAVDLVVRWLAYAWGVARSGNPLMDGLGIPSAAMLEAIFGAAGFDLTPGLESRSSCPEAIWQAARWWHEYYERDNRPGIIGAYYTPDAIYCEPGSEKS